MYLSLTKEPIKLANKCPNPSHQPQDRKAIALMQSAITSQRIQLYSHLPPVSLLPPLAPDSFLPPRPNNLIAPIPTKLPAIKPAANQSAFSWYL